MMISHPSTLTGIIFLPGCGHSEATDVDRWNDGVRGLVLNGQDLVGEELCLHGGYLQSGAQQTSFLSCS